MFSILGVMCSNRIGLSPLFPASVSSLWAGRREPGNEAIAALPAATMCSFAASYHYHTLNRQEKASASVLWSCVNLNRCKLPLGEPDHVSIWALIVDSSANGTL